MDYFTLFALPIRYSVETNDLASRYQELQKKYHPDRFAACPERERLKAIQQAATINDAYQTLKHPLRRAEYMLSLQGFELNSEQHTLHDTAFLMEQLTLREELEQIEQDTDAGERLVTFAKDIANKTATLRANMLNELEHQQWSQAAETVRKLRFLDKLHQQVEQLEEKLLGF